MATIITIVHQKGGVGKSTLALNLAYAFSANVETAVVDLDPQGTIARLKPIIGEEGPAVLERGDQPISMLVHNETYKVIFVDTPPYNNAELPELLAISDIVIVPTKAGYPDVMAIESTIGFVKQAQLKRPGLKAGIVINMVKPASALTEDVRRQLAEYELPVVAEIGDRVSFSRSVVSGGIMKSGDAKAISEFSDLVNKVLGMI
jgi:chromosome partitioning protein